MKFALLGIILLSAFLAIALFFGSTQSGPSVFALFKFQSTRTERDRVYVNFTDGMNDADVLKACEYFLNNDNLLDGEYFPVNDRPDFPYVYSRLDVVVARLDAVLGGGNVGVFVRNKSDIAKVRDLVRQCRNRLLNPGAAPNPRVTP